MRILVLALLLGAILSFFSVAVQKRVQAILRGRPAFLWTAPLLLTALFNAAALLAGAWSAPLIPLVLAYTMLPVLCA